MESVVPGHLWPSRMLQPIGLQTCLNHSFKQQLKAVHWKRKAGQAALALLLAIPFAVIAVRSFLLCLLGLFCLLSSIYLYDNLLLGMDQ